VSKKIPHDSKVHSSSLQIFNVDLDAMLKIIIINVDNEFAPTFKIHKKVVINVNDKFQKIWAVKMPHWQSPFLMKLGWFLQ
jgi:hypothetical protein